MWKWTNGSDIKVIILDMDSLSDEFLQFEYQKYIRDVQIFYVTNKLTDDSNFSDVFVYFDVPVMLNQILKKSECDSSSIISISDNILFLKEMMQNHIGTILTCDIKKDFLKNAPDFSKCDVKGLADILRGRLNGYAAEVYAFYGESKPTITLLRCESEINLNDNTTKKVKFFFGGRYYADKHKYLYNDPLSYMVKMFKNNYIKPIDLFYDSAICFIKKYQHIDILTYVPLKPSDIFANKFDRFASLKLEKNANEGMCLQKIIKCTKDFSQKTNDLNKRRENVKNAFEVLDSLEGKSVLVIDDVCTSGSTIEEVIRVLYNAGAENVTALLLSTNQITESHLEYNNIYCRVCNSKMILKMNNREQTLFFGCEHYNAHSERPTYTVKEGIDNLKIKNILPEFEDWDLEDEY